MQTLNNLAIVGWARMHPRVAAWIVLSLGMIVILVIEAANVGLLPGQWLALAIACVLVAGACVWIISWEDADDRENEIAAARKTGTLEVAAVAAGAGSGDAVIAATAAATTDVAVETSAVQADEPSAPVNEAPADAADAPAADATPQADASPADVTPDATATPDAGLSDAGTTSVD